MAELRERYGGCKPCLHGSDAHTQPAVGQPTGDRFTWIKGALTFDGLRQACIDPEGRAFVGAEPPKTAMPSQVIAQVDVQAAPWAKTTAIPLNPGLVAIIGARGSRAEGLTPAEMRDALRLLRRHVRRMGKQVSAVLRNERRHRRPHLSGAAGLPGGSKGVLRKLRQGSPAIERAAPSAVDQLVLGDSGPTGSVDHTPHGEAQLLERACRGRELRHQGRVKVGERLLLAYDRLEEPLVRVIAFSLQRSSPRLSAARILEPPLQRL